MLSFGFLFSPFPVAEDKFAWLRDDEFSRQALAGINPVNIERLQVYISITRPTRRGH